MFFSILALVATLPGVFGDYSDLQFRSWDYVVSNGGNVTFSSKNGSKTDIYKVPGAKNIRGLAYDHVNETLFLSDYSKDGNNVAIHAIKPDEAGWAYTAILNQTNNFQIGPMVFDQESRWLFMIDNKKPAVIKMHVPLIGESSRPEILYDFTGYSLYGLTLDPCNRYLYWSSCADVCKIQRSKLHGGYKEVIIKDDTMGHISGLAIDHSAGKLYWLKGMADFKYQIWRSNLDGTNLELFHQGEQLQGPSNVAVDNKAVYWTDLQAALIIKAENTKSVRDRPTEVKFYNDTHMQQGHDTMSILTRDSVEGIDCKGTSITEENNPENATTPLPTAENGRTIIIVSVVILVLVIVIGVLSFYVHKFRRSAGNNGDAIPIGSEPKVPADSCEIENSVNMNLCEKGVDEIGADSGEQKLTRCTRRQNISLKISSKIFRKCHTDGKRAADTPV